MNKLFSPTIKKLLITVISQGIILGLSVITGFVLPNKIDFTFSIIDILYHNYILFLSFLD